MKFNPILSESDFLESVNKYKFTSKKVKVLESEKNEIQELVSYLTYHIDYKGYAFYFGDKYFKSDLNILQANIKTVETVISKLTQKN